jgi:hypothetical protein
MKGLAREFLWFFITLILSLPLAIVFLWFMGFTPETINLDERERTYVWGLYILGYVVSFLAIYIMRFTAMAIRTLTNPEPEPQEEEA